jgi:hypothetical protein
MRCHKCGSPVRAGALSTRSTTQRYRLYTYCQRIALRKNTSWG